MCGSELLRPGVVCLRASETRSIDDGLLCEVIWSAPPISPWTSNMVVVNLLISWGSLTGWHRAHAHAGLASKRGPEPMCRRSGPAP